MNAEIIGYLALGFGLVAIGMKRMLTLRIIHAFSALSYIIYGHMISATPIMIGGSLFLAIHGYHLFRMRRELIIRKQNEHP